MLFLFNYHILVVCLVGVQLRSSKTDRVSSLASLYLKHSRPSDYNNFKLFCPEQYLFLLDSFSRVSQVRFPGTWTSIAPALHKVLQPIPYLRCQYHGTESYKSPETIGGYPRRHFEKQSEIRKKLECKKYQSS